MSEVQGNIQENVPEIAPDTIVQAVVNAPYSRLLAFEAIDQEREYQKKWGEDFDNANTINDWIAYIVKFLGKTVSAAGTAPGQFNKEEFRKQLVKVGALAVAVLERDDFAPRHYDVQPEPEPEPETQCVDNCPGCAAEAQALVDEALAAENENAALAEELTAGPVTEQAEPDLDSYPIIFFLDLSDDLGR